MSWLRDETRGGLRASTWADWKVFGALPSARWWEAVVDYGGESVALWEGLCSWIADLKSSLHACWNCPLHSWILCSPRSWLLGRLLARLHTGYGLIHGWNLLSPQGWLLGSWLLVRYWAGSIRLMFEESTFFLSLTRGKHMAGHSKDSKLVGLFSLLDVSAPWHKLEGFLRVVTWKVMESS